MEKFKPTVYAKSDRGRPRDVVAQGDSTVFMSFI